MEAGGKIAPLFGSALIIAPWIEHELEIIDGVGMLVECEPDVRRARSLEVGEALQTAGGIRDDGVFAVADSVSRPLTLDIRPGILLAADTAVHRNSASPRAGNAGYFVLIGRTFENFGRFEV